MSWIAAPDGHFLPHHVEHQALIDDAAETDTTDVQKQEFTGGSTTGLGRETAARLEKAFEANQTLPAW